METRTNLNSARGVYVGGDRRQFPQLGEIDGSEGQLEMTATTAMS